VLKKIVQKVIPSYLTSAEFESLPDQVLDVGPRKLEWIFESGFIPLIFGDAGDRITAIDKQISLDPFGSTFNRPAAIKEQFCISLLPMWTDFVLLSLCLPTESSYSSAYLEVLDSFIHSRTESHITAIESGNWMVRDLFFDQLPQISMDSCYSLDYKLLVAVLGKLLRVAQRDVAQTGAFWSVLRIVFPPQYYFLLERKLRGDLLTMGHRPSSENANTQKHELEFESGEEISEKRLKSALSSEIEG
jgi:hypothetical protein